ncbi:large conductance mechanosensitive channel protein MscL [Micromonospora sp. DR5-3]|uniref:large conductance mechanosensitive channel protein MscL n=1 Tax=unclassified Micromonospora TaxID=2617518 RepID=UPI0011DA8CF6|nr:MULTISPECIES: large conductance mechanosensitive channel protein MscL [unclassified Micromonospora]MCW3818852.1 large conductance mechanosensitive channel protein MscL [Micromonospora sp. DR5-3]TYC25741.1 large conductance mechanosensitive channel protein MscL [Micromonospora sp. MP36]
MLKGFKDFIMRGNVVDLAVGVVIGAAFTGVVTAFTNSFLKPIIKLVGGGEDQFAGAWEISKGNFMDWAAFVNAAITFLITAAVLYFLVVFPMNKLAERRKRGEEPPPKAPSEEVRLLTEIRDALLAGNHATPAQRGALDDVLGRRQEPPAAR